MDAVPFIFDRFSNGSVSLFTFTSVNRVILTAVSSTTIMYSYPNPATLSNGAAWSTAAQPPSHQSPNILPQ